MGHSARRGAGEGLAPEGRVAAPLPERLDRAGYL
jgi:hypothetical protein